MKKLTFSRVTFDELYESKANVAFENLKEFVLEKLAEGYQVVVIENAAGGDGKNFTISSIEEAGDFFSRYR